MESSSQNNIILLFRWVVRGHKIESYDVTFAVKEDDIRYIQCLILAGVLGDSPHFFL